MRPMDWALLERAVGAERWDEALRLALEGWRRCKHPSFGDLVDVLGARLPAFAPRGDFHRQWLEAMERATDVGPLARTIGKALPMPRDRLRWRSQQRAFAPLVARIAALASHPDDPRSAAALIEMLVELPYWQRMSASVTDVAKPALELIVRIADPRTVPALQRLLDGVGGERSFLGAGFSTWAEHAVPRAMAEISAVSLDDAAVARAERLLARVRVMGTGAGTDEELFSRVAADLTKDEPRLVLADFWQEQGSARGELVALQVAAKDPHRATALVRKHEAAWIGPLAHVSTKRVYARGFLARCTLLPARAADEATWAAASVQRDLRTLTDLLKGNASETHYRQMLANATGLETLRIYTRSMAEDFAVRGAPVRVSCLRLEVQVDVEVARALAASPAFPHLEAVAIGTTAGRGDVLVEAAAAFARRGVQRLEALPITMTGRGAEFAAFLASPFGSERCVWTNAKSWLLVRRGTGDALVLEVMGDDLQFAHEVLPALRELVSIEEVRLRLPPDLRARSPMDDRFRETFRGLTVVPDAGWRDGSGEI